MSNKKEKDDLPDELVSTTKSHLENKLKIQKTIFSRKPAVDTPTAEALVKYHDIFEHVPIGIWEEDYSEVKTLIDR